MDHRLKLVKFLLENKAKRISFKKDSESVQELFRKLESNIHSEDNSTRGSATEHLARMVHSVRSLHVAHHSNLLPKFIEDFSKLSKKGTSANGDDAIEYYIDPKTGEMKSKNIDVKGINTTISQRADSEQREVMGITDEFNKLNKRIQELVKGTKPSTLPKDSKEAVPHIKRILKSESGKEYKALSKRIEDNTRQKIIDPTQLKGFITGKFQLDNPDVAWSLMPPGKKSKARLILGPSTEEGQKQVPVIVPGKTLKQTLERPIFDDPKIGNDSQVYRNIKILKDPDDKDNLEKRTISANPEIVVRMSDLSKKGRQRELEAVSKEKGQEELQFASIDPDMLETLRSHITDNELLGRLSNHLSGFVRSK